MLQQRKPGAGLIHPFPASPRGGRRRSPRREDGAALVSLSRDRGPATRRHTYLYLMSRPRHTRGGNAVRAAVYSARLDRRPHVSVPQAIEMITLGRAEQITTSSDRYAIRLLEDDHFEPSRSPLSPAGITCSEMQAAAEGHQRAMDKVNAWGATTIRHNQAVMTIC